MGSVVQRKIEIQGKRQFRAMPKDSNQFLHIDGNSLTQDETYAWYGSVEQFQKLKQKNLSEGLWIEGTKWILKRAWWWDRKAQHAETEYA